MYLAPAALVTRAVGCVNVCALGVVAVKCRAGCGLNNACGWFSRSAGYKNHGGMLNFVRRVVARDDCRREEFCGEPGKMQNTCSGILTSSAVRIDANTVPGPPVRRCYNTSRFGTLP